MEIYWWAILIVGVGAILDVLRHRYRTRKYYQGFKRVQHVPLFGMAFKFFDIKDTVVAAFYTNLEEIMKADPNITKFIGRLGPMEYAFMIDSKLLEKMFTSQQFLSKSTEYGLLERWLGKGLLTSTGQKWKRDRKFLTPAFHFNNLNLFMNCFNKAGDILIQKLKAKVGQKSVDMHEYVTLCTLDVICEAVMGISMNAQSAKNQEYVESVRLMTDSLIKRVVSVWKLVDFIYPLSPDYWKEQQALKILHNMSTSVIVKRREHLLKHPELYDDKKCTNFLDMLLLGCGGNDLTNDDIREQVDTFMFEGHDTTASAIGSALYLLSKNPHVQEKAYQEIISIVGTDKSVPMTFENINDMHYVTLIVKETLRYFPSVPFIGRTVEEDVEIGGVCFPKGVHLIIPIILMHRRIELYDNPEQFIPERFSKENWHGDNPYKYVPFSAGFRNCIGQKFAMLEVKSLLAKVIRNFKLLEVPNYTPELEVDVILRIRNGIPVRLENRN